METDLRDFVERLVKEPLTEVRKNLGHRNILLEEMDIYQKKRLWDNIKYAIASDIASFYARQFPEIEKVFYGDIAAGQWVQGDEQWREMITGADLDLLIIVSDSSTIPHIEKMAEEMDCYFLESLERYPLTAERLSTNFLELHINDVYAMQAEKDPGSCGAYLVYERPE